jgi:hypothetical protein
VRNQYPLLQINDLFDRLSEPKCLIGLTYVLGITKFELHKGMKKKLLVAQGMVLTSSW